MSKDKKMEAGKANELGRTIKVDSEKYLDMRQVLLKMLPAEKLGLSQNKIRVLVI